MNIAIIGATSHIAKGLIKKIALNSEIALYLFSRRKKAVAEFVEKNKINPKGNFHYEEKLVGQYDVIINCVGFGKASILKNAGSDVFSILEKYDNYCIDYLRGNPNTLYLYFSSGAVYGTNISEKASIDMVSTYSCNYIGSNDFYRIAKLYTEAKHRALADYIIWDIRVFNYFSEFIDLDGEMLITEIANSIINMLPFKTNRTDIVRDFVCLDDLFALVSAIISKKSGNGVVDLYSRKAVHKLEMLEFLKQKYNLHYYFDEDFIGRQLTGKKNIYCSGNRAAERIFGYSPAFTSLEVIDSVLRKLILY